ncbi:hypothetical protein Y1Q_0000652 [Alligator mississippiensis]|uniref:Uncharacterized protein n=1 Tax=Alligator mississippiensis TaxID=8496 RepID=A0A151MBZ0_ALLMI|nr:hypothetical protein Y1Q_0000652 [Alligator mississippiensis]
MIKGTRDKQDESDNIWEESYIAELQEQYFYGASYCLVNGASLISCKKTGIQQALLVVMVVMKTFKLSRKFDQDEL